MNGSNKNLAAWVGALALLGGVVYLGLRSEEEEVAELTLAEQYELDVRLRPLIYDCNFTKTFDAPVADMVPLLVSKLNHTTKDALRQARKELGQIGVRAVPELEALWDEILASGEGKWRSGVLENILQTCSLIDDPAILPILRQAIHHNVGTVRVASLPGLTRHGGTEDYDAISIWAVAPGSVDIKAKYLAAMAELDPLRFYRDSAQWLANGEHPALWDFIVLDICDCRDPEMAARFKEIVELRVQRYHPFLLAPAAALGDMDAMADLHVLLNHERPPVRQYVVQALGRIGAYDSLAPMIDDDHNGVRTMVVKEFIDHDSELSTSILIEASQDSLEEIKKPSLRELCKRGHSETVSMLLEQLSAGRYEREIAIDALRRGWESNPGSPERAFERLMEAWRIEDSDDVARLSILQAMSSVPLPETASFLLDFGRQFEGDIQGRDPHRWACAMIWNTGEHGRDLLRSEYPGEKDPFRRLDFIEYIWQDHSDASREVLLEQLLAEGTDPYELLYLADRLIRIGPADIVAPVLKRVYYNNTHRVARPALQCMLWLWYGQHDFQ